LLCFGGREEATKVVGCAMGTCNIRHWRSSCGSFVLALPNIVSMFCLPFIDMHVLEKIQPQVFLIEQQQPPAAVELPLGSF